MLSGSVGLTGSADTNIVLLKTPEDKSKIQLSITGRDVEYTEKILAFNNVSFKWEVMCENIEDMTEQFLYSGNPIVSTIKKLVEDSPNGVKINATDLLAKIFEFTGIEVKQTPNALSREINSNLRIPLLKYDRIFYDPPNSNGGSGGRILFFSKSKNVQI